MAKHVDLDQLQVVTRVQRHLPAVLPDKLEAFVAHLLQFGEAGLHVVQALDHVVTDADHVFGGVYMRLLQHLDPGGDHGLGLAHDRGETFVQRLHLHEGEIDLRVQVAKPGARVVGP
ncbi:hypothetical protein D3C76_1439280 [compost metagenome]